MRNIRCPHYSGCLDAAIELNLRDWECSGCIHRREVGPVDPAEIEGCFLLLWTIFDKEFWRRVRLEMRR